MHFDFPLMKSCISVYHSVSVSSIIFFYSVVFVFCCYCYSASSAPNCFSSSSIFYFSLSLHLCGPHYFPLSDESHCLPFPVTATSANMMYSYITVRAQMLTNNSDRGRTDQIAWIPMVMGDAEGKRIFSVSAH